MVRLLEQHVRLQAEDERVVHGRHAAGYDGSVASAPIGTTSTTT